MVGSDRISQAWKRKSKYTVEQAAALMAGFNPNEIVFAEDHINVSDTKDADGINDVEGYFSWLQEAIKDQILEAKIIYSARSEVKYKTKTKDEKIIKKYEYFDEDKDDIGKFDIICSTTPDWNKTEVEYDHLIAWLQKKDYNDRFFNTSPKAVEEKYWDILDSNGKYFAPKLATAIRAWREVTDPDKDYLKDTKSTPKQKLLKCLEANSKSKTKWFSDKNNIDPTTDLGAMASIANWRGTPGSLPKAEKN